MARQMQKLSEVQQQTELARSQRQIMGNGFMSTRPQNDTDVFEVLDSLQIPGLPEIPRLDRQPIPSMTDVVNLPVIPNITDVLNLPDTSTLGLPSIPEMTDIFRLPDIPIMPDMLPNSEADVFNESAMPIVAEPPISESGSFNIEYHAPTININGGNVDSSILAQIQAILEEDRRKFDNEVRRVMREESIRSRRLSLAS